MGVLQSLKDDSGILQLTLNEPGKRNALTDALRGALRDALAAAQTRPEVRAIVIAGGGGAFSSGGDIGQMTGDPDVAEQRMRVLHDIARLVMRGSRPVVAAVSGPAFGAGLSLAMCCDQVIADGTARFCASFGRLGLPPDMALSFTLPRRVGPAVARRMVLSSCVIEAAEAQRLGLVDAVVPQDRLMAEAAGRAGDLAAGTGAATGHAKTLLTAAEGDLDAALARETASYLALLATDQHKAARAAFLAKSRRAAP